MHPAKTNALPTTIAAAVLLTAAAAVTVVAGGCESDAGAGRPATDRMTETDQEARRIVALAADFAADGDIQSAHRLLRQRIPEDSPVRESDEHRRIEDQWADAMFNKAEQAGNTEDKRRILNEIADTDTVSKEKRQRALELSNLLATPVDPSEPRLRRASSADADAEEPPEPPPPKTAAPAGKFDEAAMKRALMAKMNAGTATESDLRMLRAICMNPAHEDVGCRARATAALKALKNK